jgi:hypothetical protein
MGLKYGWAVGDNYKTEHDANLLTIDRVLQLGVKDRDLATPPGAPTAGDRYIVAAAPTGAWTGHAKDIAVYTGSTWAFYTPKTGWVAFIEDEAKLSAYYSSAWSAGIAI